MVSNQLIELIQKIKEALEEDIKVLENTKDFDEREKLLE